MVLFCNIKISIGTERSKPKITLPSLIQKNKLKWLQLIEQDHLNKQWLKLNDEFSTLL